MSLSFLLIAGLACYRLSKMIAVEEGPFAVFEKFRNLFLENNWTARGVRCQLCVSFWVALPLSWLSGDLLWFLYWPAISGLAALLVKYERPNA